MKKIKVYFILFICFYKKVSLSQGWFNVKPPMHTLMVEVKMLSHSWHFHIWVHQASKFNPDPSLVSAMDVVLIVGMAFWY